MEEQWKPIPGFEGYEVSDCGRVRSYWRQEKGSPIDDQWVVAEQPQRILSTNGRSGRLGYPAVNLRGTVYPVHRLVLLAFVGSLPEGMETRHLDGNPENNNLSNLCYGTPSENTYDMYKHGYRGPRTLTSEQVEDMRRMAQRGGTRDELAEIFNVCPDTVSDVCLGRSYDDCPGPIISRMRRRSKLSDRQITEIRRKLNKGAVGRNLAYQYGVHESMISRIKSGERRSKRYGGTKTDQD